MGSDRCHTVTHNVPIQAQHPPSWPRKVRGECPSHPDSDSSAWAGSAKDVGLGPGDKVDEEGEHGVSWQDTGKPRVVERAGVCWLHGTASWTYLFRMIK